MTDSSDIAARAREALEGITPGPWTLAREGWACIASGADSVIHAFVDMECPNCEENINDSATVAVSIEDAEFIAAAPDLVRSLLAALETAETELRAVEELADNIAARGDAIAEANFEHVIHIELHRQHAEMIRAALSGVS